MDEVVISPERATDQVAIAEVVGRAFAHQPAVVDMVAAIRASRRYRPGLAFVARVNDSVVGFVMLSGTDLVTMTGERWEVLTLTPLAVLPDHQRVGIGSALVRAALHEADRRDEPLVVLEGSPSYYGRLGFKPAAAYGVTLALPDWAPPEAAQVYLLSKYDERLTGRIEYPPAIALLTA